MKLVPGAGLGVVGDAKSVPGCAVPLSVGAGPWVQGAPLLCRQSVSAAAVYSLHDTPTTTTINLTTTNHPSFLSPLTGARSLPPSPPALPPATLISEV
ncbi:hypothetical protein E2C01_087436 [Portunus trituberculatus]|uniref:Uncharacterized protein n=1 Tax=Portunus trituberculatus TaxID=210409 RepID=A0A5B7JDC9_PORTR|nr:hypothetical protein [Portunus trituberculatus]